MFSSYLILYLSISVAKHGSPRAVAIRTNTKYRNAPTNLQTSCIEIPVHRAKHLTWDYFKLSHTLFHTETDGSPPANLHINWLVLTCILACDFYLCTLRSAVSPYGCLCGCSFSKSRHKDKMCPCNRTLAWKLMWGCCGWLFNICVCHYQPVIHV